MPRSSHGDSHTSWHNESYRWVVLQSLECFETTHLAVHFLRSIFCLHPRPWSMYGFLYVVPTTEAFVATLEIRTKLRSYYKSLCITLDMNNNSKKHSTNPHPGPYLARKTKLLQNDGYSARTLMFSNLRNAKMPRSTTITFDKIT